MKTALATVTLFLFFFTFSTKTPLVRAATPEPVLDISGQKLKAGASYYVLPDIWAKGGGLTFGTVTNNTCPRAGLQERSETLNGEPVQFLPENPKNHVIFTSRNLNIKFTRAPTPTSCEESRVWRLTKFVSEAMHVGTNGVAGNKDFTAIFNWFMIEKAEREGVYKLKFCPKEGVVTCEDLGIFFVGNDGKKYVGLANPGKFQELRVVFVKANDASDDRDAVMSS